MRLERAKFNPHASIGPTREGLEWMMRHSMEYGPPAPRITLVTRRTMRYLRRLGPLGERVAARVAGVEFAPPSLVRAIARQLYDESKS